MSGRAALIWAFGLAAIVAGIGAGAGLGLLPGPAQAPVADGHPALASLTLPVVLGAGLVDGLNPCAFAVLLIFISSTLALLARQASAGGAAHHQRALLGMGAVFIVGIFLTYLALGVGLLGAATIFRAHFVSRFAALAAVLLGLLLVKEALLPELGALLTVPARLHEVVRRWARRATLPGLFGAGVVVALCTVPCSGAIYLAALALLAAQTTQLEGFAYLVLYNLAFVAPLVVILLVASSRPLMNRLGRWQLHHRGAMKFALGSFTVLLGLVVLRVV